MAINWEAVAMQVGDLNWQGNVRKGSGTESGMRALEILLGEDNLRDAVDYFISLEPGWDTAEMVMKIIRSRIAMSGVSRFIEQNPTQNAGAVRFFCLEASLITPPFPGFLIS